MHCWTRMPCLSVALHDLHHENQRTAVKDDFLQRGGSTNRAIVVVACLLAAKAGLEKPWRCQGMASLAMTILYE